MGSRLEQLPSAVWNGVWQGAEVRTAMCGSGTGLADLLVLVLARPFQNGKR